ncbi:hypothetical protein [Xanthomonas fragariae]|uniref:hypothetical protein n=1 Tax=Xanthomonas fragariae TaxID=48664 RepID=UPI001ABDA615|nr:hypothetical protein [Xanthomonas fragariae]UKR52334.1 hypothetical protein K4A87_17435 [Xanthomonas fragariae]
MSSSTESLIGIIAIRSLAMGAMGAMGAIKIYRLKAAAVLRAHVFAKRSQL